VAVSAAPRVVCENIFTLALDSENIFTHDGEQAFEPVVRDINWGP